MAASLQGRDLSTVPRRGQAPAPAPVVDEAPPSKKPTRLAIGMEGGFNGGVEKVEYEESYSLLVLPEFTIIPLPQKIQESIRGIQSAHTATKQEAIAAWDGDKRIVSKHAMALVQLDNGVKVLPSGWKCSMCDLTSNLWMNLTDGTILCGRKYFDGSGGNNHAVDYYADTRYPLAVKLGTITPDGGDVYSYDEEDMVLDPLLSQHLAHFGIDITSMTKTDATMTELEIDMNMRIGEWSIIQESGKTLVPRYGPGYTGMRNLGNSCYLNSVMQVMFSLPEFKQRYFDNAGTIFQNSPANPTSDFDCQLSKLAVGLLSGQYSREPPSEEAPSNKETKPPKEQEGILPMMFQALIGRDHPEFSTMRQQDAQEFYLHLLALIDKNQRTKPGTLNAVDSFRFQTEERIECVASGKVRYSLREDNLLPLPVPLDTATNLAEVAAWEDKKKELEANKHNPNDIVRAKVPFTACLERFALAHEISDFYSTAVGGKGLAKKTSRFTSFPDYLMIQMVKFTFAEDWVPKKIDVLVDAPDTLDLSHLRGCGLQPGEVELPDGGDAPANQQEEKPVEIDEGVVMQLVSMGFDLEGCKRGVFNTQNQGVEPAMNWILEHMGDPDFAAPFEPPKPQSKTSAGPPVSEDSIVIVMSLGFTREQAIKALKATDGNVERAADWVFSHMTELAAMEVDQPSEVGPTYHDGPGKYELTAFISHMGTSTMCGHYVCHIKKDGKWIIFNDAKVAESAAPPRELAYLYLYKRVGTS
ncbi:ubiquitin carboxyl-terminal hydrolase 5-like [Halichondria panicea]|uniref:ubiquitin carboxyl-terminal hydrolase 5-like n=1 Tax=Halichondria panicea TaxID=6063 RepID=UPI00312B8E09